MDKKLLFIFLLITSICFSQKTIKNLSTGPNPFEQETTISFESEIEQNAIVLVKNILGKIVFKKQIKVEKGKNLIPFFRKDLQAGMYIYSIQNSKEVHSKRFVIK